LDANGNCARGEIWLWDVATRQPTGGKLLTDTIGVVYSIAFSPDGQTLASGGCGQLDANGNCARGEIWLWDVATRQPLDQLLNNYAASVISVAFSPDGKTLASDSCELDTGGSCQRGGIQLWDIATHPPQRALFGGHTNWVSSIAFSPDGQTLASGSDDATIILWNVATGKARLSPLTGHTSAVLSIAFGGSDGTLLASGSSDGSVILWDVATGKRLGPSLTGHASRVNSVAFTPDGQTLASGGNDATVILWDLNFDSWKTLACQIAGRNLTWAEWVQYIPAELYRATCPNIPLDPIEWLNAAAAYDLTGDVQQAEAARAHAVALAIKTDDGYLNTTVCASAQANDQVLAVVKPACQRAVELAIKTEDVTVNLDTCVALADIEALRDDARPACRRAVELALKIEDPFTNNDVCWRLSTRNFAEIALPACNRAAELEPGDGSFLDSRGLARALTGDYAGAIEDFKFIVKQLKEGAISTLTDPQGLITERESFIADLEAGKPISEIFTPKVLKKLQSE